MGNITNRTIGIGFPLWLVVLIAAILTFRGFLQIRRIQRISPTLCKSCGYDLRAGHDKCPECGEESTVPILKHVKVEPRRL